MEYNLLLRIQENLPLYLVGGLLVMTMGRGLFYSAKEIINSQGNSKHSPIPLGKLEHLLRPSSRTPKSS